MNLKLDGNAMPLGLDWIVPAFAINFAAVSIVVALAVWIDAANLSEEGKRLRLAGPVFWFLVSLFFGLPGAIFYWAAHRSTLAGELEQVQPEM